MHPAPSIIAFTTASGAGYGLLFLLGLAAPAGLIPPTRSLGATALGLALGLITLGLFASLLHLGHPERAWRAVSQWRSSWLSREGAMALLTYPPALVFAAGWVWLGSTGGWIAVSGLLAAIGAALTVYCTSMIYASLKPIREWRQPLVPPVYLAFALMTGALLLHALLLPFGGARGWAAALALLATALLTYLPALVFAAGWVLLGSTGGWIAVSGLLAAIGAALTVYCTSMIYASLKPIREWRQPLVPPVYLTFSLMTGALLLHALVLVFGGARGWAAALALLATALAFSLKGMYWAALGRAERGPTPESATGLGALGKVRMLEPPHTQTSYLLREMGFCVARRHATKLRWYACLFGGIGAALLTVLALLSSGTLASLLALLAALSGITGVMIERWLFFAEATHTVTLYYGRRAG